MEGSTMAEGVGSSEMECTNVIETTPDSFDGSVIFHLVADILGFVLYMHHQIPSLLQDISFEFDSLQQEYKDLEETLAVPNGRDLRASLRRKHVCRKRELKQGIRRLEKLMTKIDDFKKALQLLITQMPHLHRVALVLGPSPLRPIHLYELSFTHGRIVSTEFTRTKLADGLSRKAIRTLISKGAGSDRASGPSKLFLLVQAPSSLNLPLHFLPKRDFRYNKKIVPFMLRFKCRTEHLEMNAHFGDIQTDNSMFMNSKTEDNIWFLCRHTIKGLASEASSMEE